MSGIIDLLKISFSGFSFWQIVAYTVILPVLLFLFLYLTKPHISWGKFTLSLFNFPGKRSSGTPPHATCPNRGDILVREEFVRRTYSKITRIECHEMMSGMMRRVDSSTQRIKTLLLEEYVKLLEVKIGSGSITSHRDYLDYASILEHMIGIPVKNKFREILYDPEDIPSVDSETFESYIADFSRTILGVMREHLTLWYVSEDRYIGCDQLLNQHEEKTEAIRNLIRVAIISAKRTESTYLNQLEELKNKIRQKDIEILGFPTL